MLQPNRGRGVASSRFTTFISRFSLIPFYFFNLYVGCLPRSSIPVEPAIRAGDGLCDLHRPPASLRSLITFFIAANFKFAFAALPLLTMTAARRTGERMPALFWCGNGANGGRGDYLHQVLYNPRWRCFPPSSLLSCGTSLFGSAHGGCELS